MRFKAEINVDGRVITRMYLSKMDLEALLKVSYRQLWYSVCVCVCVCVCLSVCRCGVLVRVSLCSCGVCDPMHVWWCSLPSPAPPVCAGGARLPVHCTGGAAAAGAQGESGGQTGDRD